MPKLSGEIGHIGILDLSWAKNIKDLAEITKIAHVGVVRVPEHLYEHIFSIPLKHVGIVEKVPRAKGAKTELTGQTRVTGEFLANGDPETTLVVTGTLVVMPPLESIGFSEIRVTGQLILPRGTEGILSTKLGSLNGQIVYCSFDKGLPRLFMGKESVGAEFLELLPDPVPWVILGDLTIDDDVTAEMFRAKVPEIVLTGNLIAPKALIPTLQVLATERTGVISVKDSIKDSAKEGAPEQRAQEEGEQEESPWSERD